MNAITNAADTTLTESVRAITASSPHYSNDLWIGGILVCTFILAGVLSDRKHYLPHLLRDFFLPRERALEGTRTTNIVYIRIGLYLVCLSCISLLLSIHALEQLPAATGHGFLWIQSGGLVLLFYLLKLLFFTVTNHIFFDSSTTILWKQSYANWTILSTIPLYLLAVVALFFNLSSQAILWSLSSCIVLFEMCLLYKAFHIFSAKKYGILQIFVYLCTLELMPLLVVGKALVLFV